MTADAIIALRRNLRHRYGLHADLEMINIMLASKLSSLIMEDIESVIGTWTATQLADGLEANAEAMKLEAASEESEH